MESCTRACGYDDDHCLPSLLVAAASSRELLVALVAILYYTFVARMHTMILYRNTSILLPVEIEID